MADSEDFATTEASKPIRLKFAIAIHYFGFVVTTAAQQVSLVTAEAGAARWLQSAA